MNLLHIDTVPSHFLQWSAFPASRTSKFSLRRYHRSTLLHMISTGHYGERKSPGRNRNLWIKTRTVLPRNDRDLVSGIAKSMARVACGAPLSHPTSWTCSGLGFLGCGQASISTRDPLAPISPRHFRHAEPSFLLLNDSASCVSTDPSENAGANELRSCNIFSSFDSVISTLTKRTNIVSVDSGNDHPLDIILLIPTSTSCFLLKP